MTFSQRASTSRLGQGSIEMIRVPSPASVVACLAKQVVIPEPISRQVLGTYFRTNAYDAIESKAVIGPPTHAGARRAPDDRAPEMCPTSTAPRYSEELSVQVVARRELVLKHLTCVMRITVPRRERTRRDSLGEWHSESTPSRAVSPTNCRLPHLSSLPQRATARCAQGDPKSLFYLLDAVPRQLQICAFTEWLRLLGESSAPVK
jgi:hypothetical protein